MNWLIDKFLKGYLVKWFTALALPGKKRILGIVIFALATAAVQFPEFKDALLKIVDVLTALGPEQYQEVGVVTFVVGVAHWLVRKYVSGQPADLPAVPNVINGKFYIQK